MTYFSRGGPYIPGGIEQKILLLEYVNFFTTKILTKVMTGI